MDNCKIVQDLLPSYCDGLTSEETNELIRRHIADCPLCAQMLERMSQQPPREVIDHREQFRRTLRQHEQVHRMKRLRAVLCCAVGLVLVLLIWVNSFNLALRFAGIDRDRMTVLETDLTNCYILHSRNDEYALTTIAKNDILNFWYIAGTDATDGAEKPYVTAAWFGGTSHRWFEGRDLETDFEIHYLYFGNNAVAPIQLTSQDIPGDVLVKVNQQGSHWWVHMVSDDTDALNSLDLITFLTEKGWIN